MKIEIEFSGLMCGIRRWEKGSHFPADDHSRHPVVMLGAKGGNTLADGTKVPIHVPRLTIPLAAIEDTSIDPLHIVDTPNAQIGVWDLSGMRLSLALTNSTDGVRFSTDTRPRGYESKRKGEGPAEFDSWEDLAWIVEMDRIFGSHIQLAVDPDRPDPALVSFAMMLNAGELQTLKPRNAHDAGSTFSFDPEWNPEYWQAFSDRMRVAVRADSVMVEFEPLGDGTSGAIRFKQRNARVCISSLSQSMISHGEDPDRLTHFTGIYQLFTGLSGRPVPVRKSAPQQDGALTVEPFFCLPAFHNIDY